MTSSGTLEHSVYSSGANTWQTWGLPNNNTTAVSAAVAGMPDGSSQLIEITPMGTLQHTIRFANGSWQASGWGIPAGSTNIARSPSRPCPTARRSS